MANSVNRLVALVRSITCAKVQNARVFNNRGSRSIPTIEAKVDIAGMSVPMTIWGRLSTEHGNEAITFAASLPKGVSMDYDDPDYKALTDHVERFASVWAGFNDATDKAAAKLKGEAEATSKRVRLVHTAKGAKLEELAPTVTAAPAAPTA